MRTLTIIAANGVKFTVLDLQPGEFGAFSAARSEQRQVEFYDAHYRFTQWGQFVTRYNADQITGKDRSRGLDLDGGVPAWSIDAKTYRTIQAWLKGNDMQKPTKAEPVPHKVEITGTCANCSRRITATYDQERPGRLFTWYHVKGGREEC